MPLSHESAGGLFDWALGASLATSIVVLLVLLLQSLLGHRLGARWRYALWGLVVARALAPALPESGLSLFNFTPDIATPRAVAIVPQALPPVVVRIDLANARLAPAPRATAHSVPVLAHLPAMIWLGGCLLFAGFTLLRAAAFARRLRRAERVTDESALRLLDACHRAIGLTRAAPPIVIVPGVAGPALTGVWRPRIVLPPGLIERLDDEELRLVLTHELTHLRRRDLVAEWLLVLVRTIHWFNPLVWYAVARCRADRELACDEQVMRLCAGEIDQRRYGRTILKLAQGLPPGRRPALAGAVGILEGGAQLKRRIRMIARFNRTRAHTRARWSATALALLALVALASCTLTDRKSAPAETAVPNVNAPPDESGRVTRVYDVRDLVIEIPNFVPPPVVMGEPASRHPEDEWPGKSREQLTAEVMKLIKETVTPATWDVPGGGAVRESQGQFIVTATPGIQREVEQLLSQLRETRRVQITIETRFIAIDDAKLADLKGEMAGLFRGDLRPDPDDKPAAGSTTFLTDAQYQSLMRIANDHKTIVTAPRITLFNGQRAYVLVQSQRAYVKSLEISKDASGKISYSPDIDVVSSGVVFDASATATADRKHVTMVLRPRLSTLVALRDVPFPNSPPGENLSVQQPDVQISELRTVASVPVGKTLLLRGLRGSMNLGTEGDTQASAVRDVLVLVKPSIIVQPESGSLRLPSQ